MTPARHESIRYWYRQLDRLDRKAAAVAAGELKLRGHGEATALRDARRGVAGLIAELQRTA